MANEQPLIQWDERQTSRVDAETIEGRHRLHETELFTDEALVDIFDKHDRRLMYFSTMGRPGEGHDTWMNGEPGDASGAEILEAIKKGRLWLNLLRLCQNPVYAALKNRMFGEFGFETRYKTLTLLVSSPDTTVFYHVDPNQTCLLQIRGHKTLYVYPANDWSIVNPEDLERIFLREMEEELPYDPSWDARVERYPLEPGKFVLWPHNAPHRVDTGPDLNVSLSTVHYTLRAQRKEQLFRANRYFRRLFGRGFNDRRQDRLGAKLKINAFRVLNRLGAKTSRPHKMDRKFCIDASAPLGYRLYQPGVRGS